MDNNSFLKYTLLIVGVVAVAGLLNSGFFGSDASGFAVFDDGTDAVEEAEEAAESDMGITGEVVKKKITGKKAPVKYKSCEGISDCPDYTVSKTCRRRISGQNKYFNDKKTYCLSKLWRGAPCTRSLNGVVIANNQCSNDLVCRKYYKRDLSGWSTNTDYCNAPIVENGPCETRDQCQEGLFCIGGKCRRSNPGDSGTPCVRGECNSGNICVNGMCINQEEYWLDAAERGEILGIADEDMSSCTASFDTKRNCIIVSQGVGQCLKDFNVWMQDKDADGKVGCFDKFSRFGRPGSDCVGKLDEGICFNTYSSRPENAHSCTSAYLSQEECSTDQHGILCVNTGGIEGWKKDFDQDGLAGCSDSDCNDKIPPSVCEASGPVPENGRSCSSAYVSQEECTSRAGAFCVNTGGPEGWKEDRDLDGLAGCSDSDCNNLINQSMCALWYP